MANLYEIDRNLTSLVDEETGEILDFEAFEQLQLERETKLENIGLWCKNLRADIEMFKTEKKAFEDKIERAEKKLEGLKNYLSTFLGGEKFKTARVSCSFRETESVDVTDISDIPNRYLKYSEPTVDKLAIKAALKNGKEVSGAQLVKKSSLIIK